MKNAFRIISLASTTLLALGVATDAAPKKSGSGVTCSSTGTERRDGRDDSGNKVNCLFDFCTFTECGPVGNQIRCFQKTEYSNARDCKAAAATRVPRGNAINPGGVLKAR